ncbi:ABC transporter ATP-binding protein [bacterium]|nr:ABC transporter ATP-binding protein [bacterium]
MKSPFLRFAKLALSYKFQLMLGVVCMIGVNLTQFASIGTIAPFADRILPALTSSEREEVPEWMCKVSHYWSARPLTNNYLSAKLKLDEKLSEENRKGENASKEDKFLIRIPDSTRQILPASWMAKIEEIVAKLNSINPTKLARMLLVFIFVMILLRVFFSVSLHLVMEGVSQSMVCKLMDMMYRKLQELPIRYFNVNRTGDLISRITNDVNVVQATLSARLADSVAEISSLPFIVCMLLALNWKVSIFSAIFLPVIMAPIIIIGQRIRKISKKTQEKIADIVSILQETITGVRIVRAFNTEDYEIKRFDRQLRKYYEQRMAGIRNDVMVSPLTELAGILCLIVVGSLLLISVMTGEATFGTIIAYLTILLLSIKPFRSIGKLNNVIQRSKAALHRIYEVLDTVPEIMECPDPIDAPPMTSELKFDHVSFSYDEAEGKVIDDFSLTIRPGEMIALVGPSGSGKTTIANLIPRFYDCTEGSVTIDGIDVKKLSFASLRGQMGMVSQDTILFNNTIAGNIAYGLKKYDMVDVQAAAMAANAHEFIMEMPEGYNTIIGEHGVRLSGGQRQRLAIARAIFKNPSILILDEATSALDTESERLVQEAIDNLVENRTVIAIAHRLSTIRHADRIIVLKDGKVQEIGSHEELIKNENGIYYKLCMLQSSDEEQG